MIADRSQFEVFMQQEFEDEFNRRVPQHLLSVISNDKEAWNEIASNYLRIPGRIQFYLNEYDEASNDEERLAVMESFDARDFGNEIVDPNDLIKDIYRGGKYEDVSSVLYRRSVQVDGTAIGDTLILETSSSENFIPIYANFYLQQQSGLSEVATISIGTNSPSFSNILDTTLLTGLSSSGSILSLPMTGIIPSVRRSTSLYARISIPSTATVYNIVCTVIGFME